jgi:hypothetical protein
MKKILTLLFILSTATYAGLPPTSTKGAGDSSFKTTFQTDFGGIPLIHTGSRATLGIVPYSMGGTGSGNLGTGVLRATAGVIATGSVSLLSDVSNILPYANGGTNSATRPFVDLVSSESIGGTKTFSSTISGSINGNAATVTTNANLTGVITSVGNATGIASQTGIGTKFVVDTSPTLITPNIGAATGTSLSVSGQLTSTVATGTAPLAVSSTTKVTNLYADRAALADTVTTNANLTGPITSTGNATSIASQTGTGTTFVMSAAPTITGHPTIEGVTATGATGTAKFVFDTSPTFSLNLGIGGAPTSDKALTISPTINASSANFGIWNQTVFRENSTAGTGIYSQVRSGNPAYALANAYAFEAGPASQGTSSTVTNSTGYMVRDQTVGTGSKFGIQNEVSSGTNKWGYYGSGTAVNYFAGAISVGIATPDANAIVDLTSTTKAFIPPRMTTTQKNAISPATAGMVLYDSVLGALSTYNGSGWVTTSVANGTPVVPGISGGTNVDHFSQSYGATISTPCSTPSTLCAYNDALGTSAPITRNASTGNFTIAFPRTYTKAKCTYSGVTSSAGAPAGITVSSCASCASMTFVTWNTTSGAASDSYGTVTCDGTY